MEVLVCSHRSSCLPYYMRRSISLQILFSDEQMLDVSKLEGQLRAYHANLSEAKVEIDDDIYDAVTQESFIEKGTRVKVVKTSNTQLVVVKDNEAG